MSINTEIILKRLRLINFKGIPDMEIFFKPDITRVSGMNGTGKTSLMDAESWLLFGKNSKDNEKFTIKTLNATGEVIPQIEHEVQGDFLINGELVCLRRVLQEKWVKKRNSTHTEMTGNQTLFYWNEVPLKESEYVAKITAIIPEALFKLITNPMYFNLMMDWKQRREVLFSMAPPPDTAEIMSHIVNDGNRDIVDEISKMLISQRKTVDDCRAEFKNKYSKVKQELDDIPTRVDEAYKQIPEDEDYTIYEKQIEAQRLVLQDIDLKKQNLLQASKKANEGIMAEQTKKNNLQLQIQKLRHANTNAYNDKVLAKKTELKNIDDEIKQLDELLLKYDREIKQFEQFHDTSAVSLQQLREKNERLLEEWKLINAELFDISKIDITKTCYACKQDLPAGNITTQEDAARTKFNENKTARLAAERNEGVGTKTAIAQLESDQVANHDKIKTHGELKLSTAQTLSDKNTARNLVIETLDRLNGQAPQDTPEILQLVHSYDNYKIEKVDDLDFTAFTSASLAANQIINDANRKLAEKVNKEKVEKRIEELQKREETLSQELTGIDAYLYILERYNRQRIDELTASVNAKFSQTQFRLFETLVSGQDVEVCVALVNTNGCWVPFPDANNAGQINCGLDIINTLTAYNSVTAPIFIDNSEGVGTFISCTSQVVNLRFSADQKLVIE